MTSDSVTTSVFLKICDCGVCPAVATSSSGPLAIVHSGCNDVLHAARERDPSRNEAHMKSAEECRAALQKLAGRLSEMSPDDRENYFGNRSMSVTIPDLGVTYATTLGAGDDPVREVGPGEPPADIRLTA